MLWNAQLKLPMVAQLVKIEFAQRNHSIRFNLFNFIFILKSFPLLMKRSYLTGGYNCSVQLVYEIYILKANDQISFRNRVHENKSQLDAHEEMITLKNHELVQKKLNPF